MWKPEHRRAAERNDLRYPSDLTDAEWALVEPMIPPGRHGGRKRSVNVREVLERAAFIEQALAARAARSALPFAAIDLVRRTKPSVRRATPHQGGAPAS